MRRHQIGVGFGLAAIVMAGMLSGMAEAQQKKGDSRPTKSDGRPIKVPAAKSSAATEFKGSLPQHWDKLNLTGDQRKQAMEILARSAKETKAIKKQDDAAKAADVEKTKALQKQIKDLQAETKVKVEALRKQIADLETAVKSSPLQTQLKDIQAGATKRNEDLAEKNKQLKETTNKALLGVLKANQRKALEDMQ